MSVGKSTQSSLPAYILSPRNPRKCFERLAAKFAYCIYLENYVLGVECLFESGFGFKACDTKEYKRGFATSLLRGCVSESQIQVKNMLLLITIKICARVQCIGL